MKAQNQLTQRSAEKKPFSTVITGPLMQNQIKTALGNPQAAARFTSTLISVVSASEQLNACEPKTIIASALRGEGMGLVYGSGYYVVPYDKTATFLLSYKGMIQLCLATGQYADIDCIEVREGERRGRDRRTGKPVVDMSIYATDEERDRHPIIGYKAYFELKDGYYREEYWTTDELLRHADRYSQAFSLATYNRWRNGEKLSEYEQKKIKLPYDRFLAWRAGEEVSAEELRAATTGLGAWYDEGGRQQNMMKKTVLRSLLNSGYAPMTSEVRSIIRGDRDDGVLPDINLPLDVDGDMAVDGDTGELIEGTATEIKDAPAEEAPEPMDKPKRTRAAKEPVEAVADEGAPAVSEAPDDGGFAESFFK